MYVNLLGSLGWGPRSCISSKLPDSAAAAVWRTIHWVARSVPQPEKHRGYLTVTGNAGAWSWVVFPQRPSTGPLSAPLMSSWLSLSSCQGWCVVWGTDASLCSRPFSLPFLHQPIASDCCPRCIFPGPFFPQGGSCFIKNVLFGCLPHQLKVQTCLGPGWLMG